MEITILTLFPEVFSPILQTSILKKAQEKKLVSFHLVNIRDFATDSYKTVDDRPYGGGIGMIMRVDILHKALASQKKGYRILLSPKGKRYTQEVAKRLCREKHLILLCGHYEGVDARIESYVDEVISIGDYVLTGGEIPALALTDSIVRLLPGVLKDGVVEDETFEKGALEYPQYTRPQTFKKQKVPPVLLSGDHKKIDAWRKSQSTILSKRTLTRR